LLVYDSIYYEGGFWVSSYLEGKIYRLDLSGRVNKVYEGFRNPLSLTLSPKGVYLLDVGTLKLYRYSESEDRWVEEVFPIEVSHPYWISFRGDELIVVDKDKRAVSGLKGLVGSSDFLPRPLYLFDMPSSVKPFDEGVFILADGERLLLKLSWDGKVLALWELPQSPVSWGVFNGEAYLLCKGILFIARGEELLAKSVASNFIALLLADSPILWDGKSTVYFDNDGWYGVKSLADPCKLILVNGGVDTGLDAFRSLIDSLDLEGLGLSIDSQTLIESFLLSPTLERILELQSKVLPLELKLKRIYPNLLRFLDGLSNKPSKRLFNPLLKLFKLSLPFNAFWYLPWEVYWRIPREERSEFKSKLYDLPSIKANPILETLDITLNGFKRGLERGLDDRVVDDALREIGFFSWMNRLCQRALLLFGEEDEIIGWFKRFIEWRDSLDLLRLIDRPKLRSALWEILWNSWNFNSFYLSLAEERTGVIGKCISSMSGGEVRKLCQSFYAVYASKVNDRFLVSDWGEGFLYSVSLKGDLLWERRAKGPTFTLVKGDRVYVSEGLSNSILIFRLDSGDLEGKITLPEGAKAGRLFETSDGRILCSYSLKGRVFLRSLSDGKDILSSEGSFTYFTPNDAISLFLPGSVRSYVPSELKIFFDPRLITLGDWLYIDGFYVGNQVLCGKISAFHLEGKDVKDVKGIRGGYVFPVVPLSVEGYILSLFHRWGYLEDVPLDLPSKG